MPSGTGKRIIRVVLDSGLRTPPEARVLGCARGQSSSSRHRKAPGKKPKRPRSEGGRDRPRRGRAARRSTSGRFSASWGNARSRASSSKGEAASSRPSSGPGSPTSSSSPCPRSSSAAGTPSRSSKGRGTARSAAALKLGRVRSFPVGRRPDDRGVLLMFTGIITSMGVFQGYRQGTAGDPHRGPGRRPRSSRSGTAWPSTASA